MVDGDQLGELLSALSSVRMLVVRRNRLGNLTSSKWRADYSCKGRPPSPLRCEWRPLRPCSDLGSCGWSSQRASLFHFQHGMLYL